jgi:molybdenum cofactor biosynthesis enzyme
MPSGIRKLPRVMCLNFPERQDYWVSKKTSDVIPDCHPLPVEYAAITHTIEGPNHCYTGRSAYIYKTGVEVEAMHGAAVTALTMYDMLKPIDKGVEISTIRLENKTGGKTDFKNDSMPVAALCGDCLF